MSKISTHLIVHRGALGDFLLALRLAEQLSGPVVFATVGSRVRLINRFPQWGIKGMDIEERGFWDLHVTSIANKEFMAFAESVDGVLVSFVSNGADEWAKNSRRVFGGAKSVFIDPRPGVPFFRHVVEWQAEQLSHQAAEWVTPCERFKGIWKQGQSDRRIVVHPGSGGAAKRWPLDRFAALSRRLLEDGLGVRWVVNPDDLEMDKGGGLEGCLNEFDGQVMETLEGLAEACLGAGAWVGNDSGPSHLAGLLGVPTVVLFGPTDPRVWAPVGERVRVIAPQAGPEGAGLRGMDWLDVERVLAEIRSLMLP